MEENSTGKWGSGIFLAAVGLIWAIASLLAGRIVIPFLRWQGVPLTNDIKVSGVPSILIAVGLIWFSLYLHFSYFWSRTPQLMRISSGASKVTGWAATTFFAAGLLLWIFAYARHAA